MRLVVGWNMLVELGVPPRLGEHTRSTLSLEGAFTLQLGAVNGLPPTGTRVHRTWKTVMDSECCLAELPEKKQAPSILQEIHEKLLSVSTHRRWWEKG